MAVVATGVGLLLLAGGLRRRNRVAWAAAVAALAGSAVFDLLKDLDVAAAVLQATLAGWLAGQGGVFTGRWAPGDRRRVALPAVAVAVLTAGYGLTGLAVNEPGLLGRVGLGRALGDAARMSVGLEATCAARPVRRGVPGLGRGPVRPRDAGRAAARVRAAGAAAR